MAKVRNRILYTLWALLIGGILACLIVFMSIAQGWIGYMPPVEELQNPIDKFATQIISSDGKVMGTWNYNEDNRVKVSYDELPQSLIDALVSTEDERFHEHSGIDFYAVGRAVVKRLIMGQKSAGGGSTITQQLAKQLHSPRAKNFLERMMQKPNEWVIAVQLERCYTKEEIITLYLNYFDFLHNAVGIKTAAQTYFGKLPKDLTVTESAMLVGLCKNPSYYNPKRFPERCLERRNVVLGQMLKADKLTKQEFDSLKKAPLALNFNISDHNDGIANYFREFLRGYMTAKKPVRSDYPSWGYTTYHRDSIYWETDPLYGWCRKNPNRDGSPRNIYTDGLKIYTTIDSRMQKYAEEAVAQHVAKYLQPEFDKENKHKKNSPYSNTLTSKQVEQILNRSIRQSERYRVLKYNGASDKEITADFNKKIPMTVFTYNGERDTIMSPRDSILHYKSFLRCGFMSMSPKDGAVKAYVGGPHFKHFQYDMCMDGRRQVGSTMKPFLYSLAMANGMTPCDEAPNVQQTYMVGTKPWTPRNSGSKKRYGEMVTLKWGLAQSNNWISAYLIDKLSPEALVTMLHDFGIHNPEIHPSLALCLGPCDISVGEMVSAYTTFANKGIRTAPLMVTRIEDSEGNVLAQFQPRMNEVINEESAAKMVYMLKGVVDGGTGSRIRFRHNLRCEMGGKTGTTNNNSDSWFMGITPELVNGVWVGGEDPDIHFNSMTYGQGAAGALPVWAYYMQKVYADPTLGYNENAKFEMPKDFKPCDVQEEIIVEEDEVNEIF